MKKRKQHRGKREKDRHHFSGARVRRIIILALLLSGIGFLFMQSDALFKEKKEPIYLSAIAPLLISNGQEMVKAIRLVIDEVNEAGGINGRSVELSMHDDRGDPDLAERRVVHLIENEKPLLVFGHLNSSTSIATSKYYRTEGIPVITASATADSITSDSEWAFRTIPNNSSQAKFAANYIKKILKKGSISIIFDNGVYGSDLAENVKEEAQKLELDITHFVSFDRDDDNPELIINDIIADLKENGSGEIIFLATYPAEGLKIISSLKSPSSDYTFFGADMFSGAEFIRQANQYPQERARRGYYSDGILMVSPFILDIANQKAQIFRSNYIAKYGEEPTWYAAGYYDAAFVALEAIRRAELQDGDEFLAKNRQNIRDEIRKINFLEKALPGVTGNIFFDAIGDVNRPWPVGIYKRHKLISYLYQCQLNQNIKRVDNLIQSILDEDMLIIDSQLMDRIQIVYTGIDINEITNLDVKTKTYEMDFYLWFRFSGDFDDKNIEFVNAVEPIDLGEPIMERSFEETTTRAYRIKAEFKSEFDFHTYPFDEQVLRIQLRHNTRERNELIYVTDILGMKEAFSEASNGEIDDSQSAPNVSGWETISTLFYQDNISNESTLGMPEFFDGNAGIEFSRFNVAVNIKRDVFNFIFKNLFPLLLLIIVTYVIYFIPADFVEARISIGMGTLLSSGFFHLQVTESLEVEYLVAIEYFFFAVYVLAAMTIVISIASFFMYRRSEEKGMRESIKQLFFKRIEKLELTGRILHPFIIITVSAIIFYIYG